jgi:hypothetical protein
MVPVGREDFSMPEAIDYKAVLEDLRAKKASLEQAIAAVESILGGLGEATTLNGSASKAIEADTFIGMNIMQAAEKYLQMTGRPAKTTEMIAAALNQGGMSVSQGSISTILRRSDKGDSPVTRVGRSLWGLAGWYPNRPRRGQAEQVSKKPPSAAKPLGATPSTGKARQGQAE